jgi:3-oxoadipate enol-lactonase
MTDYKFATALDGTKIRYSLSGQGAGRIALVHSLGLDLRFWEPVADLLANDARVLLIDCRGHGGSDKPPGPYSADVFSDDLAAALDDARWSEAIVAGASMGGCVALAFAGRYPQRCKALGLVDTTAWYGPDAASQFEVRAARARTSGLRGLVEYQTTRWFSDEFRASHPEVVGRCIDTFVRNDVVAYAETCRLLGAVDLRALLPRITVPTAVLVGVEDHATPLPMAQALHAGIQGSSLKVIAGRHLTPLEHPDLIAAELRRLIQGQSL